MISIKLKSFQEEAIANILEQFESVDGSKKMIVKAPTGSGKTITLIGLIERFVTDYAGQYVFCWLTPGKGELEEQSKEKMDRFSPFLYSGTLFDVLTSGFNADTTYFINWESITKKGNLAIKEGERKNLFEQIAVAHRQGLRFVLLIDEEHQNSTDKAQEIIAAMDPIREIRVSATPEVIKGDDFYEIPENTVIAEQLITKALYINNGLDITTLTFDSDEYRVLIEKADRTRKNILKAYQDIHEDVNPLVLIQFPSLSDSLIEQVEKKLEELGYTYENGMVASWFSAENAADKRLNSTKLGKHNIGDINSEDSITKNDAKPVFLLFKQALSTGWDCPRAKVLVKLRDNMTETFEIQTLGRLRRMPKAVHYGQDILDCAYLYTFDEKYKEAVIKAGSGHEVQRLKLKPEAKGITLYKEVLDQDVNLVDMKKARKEIYEYFMEKYKLQSLHGGGKEARETNRRILEAHGYIMGSKLKREFLVGRYRTLSDILKANDTKEISFEVNTHTHGLLLRHEIGKYSKIIGLSYENMKLLMRGLFRAGFSVNFYKVLPLELREFYAFVINNTERLKEVFVEFEEAAGNKPTEMQDALFASVKTLPATILQEEVYPYFNESESINFNKNVYDGYNSSMVEYNKFRSTPEILFEQFCEKHDAVKFVYRNGDKGLNYISLIYQTRIGKVKNFYPDYILQMQDGTIWIIETKGGETSSGIDKNIDIECAHKLEALEKYAGQHGFKFGFVRDKNSSLYINRTGKWESDMDNPVWERLMYVLK